MKRDKVVRTRNAPKGGPVIDVGRRAAMEAIKDARRRAGLTQEQAAAKLGHATSTISRWETGGLPQSWDQLTAYANALDQAIVLNFGPAQQESPPAWAEGLATKAAEEAITRIVPPDLLDAARRLIERLEATPQPPPEAPPEGGGSQGRAGAAPR